MKSVLYAANTGSQTVTAGSPINFGSVVRKYGCNCGIAGGNATVQGAGYYDVDVNVTLNAVAVGDASISLYKDGTAIPGATAAVTAGATTDDLTVVIPAVIRQTCNCDTTITAIVSAGAVVTNAAIRIEKL